VRARVYVRVRVRVRVRVSRRQHRLMPDAGNTFNTLR
jgi:hypothetical protein